MRAFTFDHVSNDTLLADLATLVATDRQTTAALLAHLGEVDERKLYLPAACASMHAYCVRVLHLAEEVAYKRIRAARIARQFPVIFDAIAEGRLHVSGVLMLGPHLTDANVRDVLAAASHRTKAELEELVARLAPRPDLPERMERAPQAGDVNESLQLDPDPAPPPSAPDPAAGPPDPDPVPARIQARSPDRYGLQVTIDGATRDKLLRAQALLRHRHPSGELAEVLDLALDTLLEKLEKQKFGKTSQPRKAKVRGEDADARYVPNEVRRVVSERDAEQCAFVSDDGVRCTERGFLELDHRTRPSVCWAPTSCARSASRRVSAGAAWRRGPPPTHGRPSHRPGIRPPMRAPAARLMAPPDPSTPSSPSRCAASGSRRPRSDVPWPRRPKFRRPRSRRACAPPLPS